jgi:hypothetical protein
MQQRESALREIEGVLYRTREGGDEMKHPYMPQPTQRRPQPIDIRACKRIKGPGYMAGRTREGIRIYKSDLHGMNACSYGQAIELMKGILSKSI